MFYIVASEHKGGRRGFCFYKSSCKDGRDVTSEVCLVKQDQLAKIVAGSWVGSTHRVTAAVTSGLKTCDVRRHCWETR